MDFQDIIAIGIAAATAAWFAWTLGKRIRKPSCGPRTDMPAGADGFVPLADLAMRPPAAEPSATVRPKP